MNGIIKVIIKYNFNCVECFLTETCVLCHYLLNYSTPAHKYAFTINL